MQQYIFNPLGMNMSTAQRDQVAQHLVGGLNKKGKPTSHWDMASLSGAGAVLSSVHDLAKFVMANFYKDNPVFNLQREKTFQVNGMLSLALGWHIYRFKKPEIDQLYVHDGGTGGYRSVLGMDLNTQNSVIILSNISGLHFLKNGKLPNLAIDLMQNMMDHK